MKCILLLFLINVCSFTLAQKTNQELEKEISALTSPQDIKNYWIKIHEDDQSVRGKITDIQRQIDRENIKKMVLLFKFHGYPVDSSNQNNFTPNIVLTHNKVQTVNELIFPILKKAYLEEKGNEFWYIHILRVMTRARYGRDFHKKTKENIPLFYEKLSPFLKDTIDYNLEQIDSLFEEYDFKLGEILNSNLIFSKKKKRIRHNIYQTKKDKLYWQKVYSDGSFNFPQEIYWDNTNNCFRYKLLNEEIKDKVFNAKIREF